MNTIKQLLEYISKSDIYGMPLDIIAHFVLGGLIYYASRKLLKSHLKALVLILTIALLKEAFDWGVIMRNSLYLEPVKDVMVTMLGAWVIYSKSALAKKILITQ